jgi:propionyl-CoA synthetase
MSRTDDIINVAGHRLSTGAIEEVIASHPAVAECSVFPLDDEIKGQVPLGALVLKNGVTSSHDNVINEVVELVRERMGPVYSFKKVVVVKRLPKTRSGKILRGVMAKIANRQEFKMPATIDDPAILTEIKEALEHHIETPKKK